MANIMIVEDEGIVAQDIRNQLQRMGYDVAAVVSIDCTMVECKKKYQGFLPPGV